MDVARDNILDRVRVALRAPAHQPPSPTSAPVFPPVTNPEARFREEFTAVKGEFIENGGGLAVFLKGFVKIATDGSDLVDKTIGEANANVSECDVGVTSCDCLVAQTGSVIVSTLSAGGRALSVLPPTHLVIARREQLVPDLVAAMAFLRKRYDKHWPSALSVITGPSRTADIEKILVMGAHGPKRLVLYFTD
jgi:L-lactate dehydrogenase complex protein LldG